MLASKVVREECRCIDRYC